MRSVFTVIILFGAAALSHSATSSADTLAQECARNAPGGDVQTCRAALSANPGDLDLRRHLAHSLTIMADYDAAIKIHRGIVAERPDDPRAHYDLAGLLGAIKRYEEAVMPIEAAIRLEPDNILAYQAAAVIYAQVGRMKDSVAITNRAAQRGDATSMYEMSLYYQEGIGVTVDNAKALHWAREAARLNHVAAMQLMSEIYLEGLLGQARDPDKAIEWAQRVRAENRRLTGN